MGFQSIVYRGNLLSNMVDMKDIVNEVLDSGVINNQQVAFVPWQNGDFTIDHVDYIFFSHPPGGFAKEMPRHINEAPGRNTGGKHKDETIQNVSVLVKYYKNNLKVTRYSKEYRQDNTVTTKYLFHVTLQQSNKKHAHSVVKRIKREIASNPGEVVEINPICNSIEPASFTVSHGKHELTKAKGESLTASGGKLVRVSSLYDHDPNREITTYISNGTDGRQVVIEFDQPNSLSTSSYVLELIIHDNVHRFDDLPINFTEDIPLPALQGAATNCWEKNVDDYPFDYFVQTSLSLPESCKLGNTRNITSLSYNYDGLPDIIDSNGDINTSLVDMARKSGNLKSLLFTIVWESVTTGKYGIEILDQLRDFIKSAKSLSFYDMLLSIKSPQEDIAVVSNAEKEIKALIKNAKLEKKSTDLNFNAQAQTQIVAHHTIETLEVFFTNKDTPKYLIDPITEIIFVNPVIVPISEKSVSAHVVDARPGFDVFANLPFSPGQHTLKNRHLQEEIEQFFEIKVREILKELPAREAFTKTLHLLSLLQDRKELGCRSIVINDFNKAVWAHPNEIFPFILSLNQIDLNVFFRTITMEGNFPQLDLYISLLCEDDKQGNSTHKEALCLIFPTASDAYTLLKFRNMFVDEATLDKAIYLIELFHSKRQFNLLADFLDDKQASMPIFWKILRRASKTWSRKTFDDIAKTLPLDFEIKEILTADLGTVLNSLLTAEQAYKLATIQSQSEIQRSEDKLRIETLSNLAQSSQKELENVTKKYNGEVDGLKKDITRLNTTVKEFQGQLEERQKEVVGLKEKLIELEAYKKSSSDRITVLESKPAPAPAIQSAPAQPTPAQNKPAAPTPSQPAPAQNKSAAPTPAPTPNPTPTQPTPAQNKPAAPTPAPAQPTPAQNKPAPPTPAPAQNKPAPAPAPAQNKPAATPAPTPAQPAPAQNKPAPAAPAQPVPAQNKPAAPAPAPAQPAQSKPAAPTQPAPAQNKPAAPSPTPVQPTPAQNKPAPSPTPAQNKPAAPSPTPVQPAPAQNKPAAPSPTPVQPAPAQNKPAAPSPTPAQNKPAAPPVQPAPAQNKPAAPSPTPVQPTPAQNKPAAPSPTPAQNKPAAPSPTPAQNKPAAPTPSAPSPTPPKPSSPTPPKPAGK